MSEIYVECPFGHRIRANVNLSGRKLACPKCMNPVVVPQAKDELTDTGVMRILDDANATGPAEQPKVTKAPSRLCPHCSAGISDSLAVCPQCQCYLGIVPRYLARLNESKASADSST